MVETGVQILSLPLLFPETWPLRCGDALFVGLVTMVLLRVLFTGLRCRQQKTTGDWCNKLQVLWILATFCGLWQALSNPDQGAFWGAFLQQLHLGVTGVLLLKQGAKEKQRHLWRKGLLLLTGAAWTFCFSFFMILPEPIYWILWLVALGVLDVIYPQVSR